MDALKEAQDYPRSMFVVPLADVRELAEYVKHDSWRCERYHQCHCGLDALTDRMGLERIPC